MFIVLFCIYNNIQNIVSVTACNYKHGCSKTILVALILRVTLVHYGISEWLYRRYRPVSQTWLSTHRQLYGILIVFVWTIKLNPLSRRLNLTRNGIILFISPCFLLLSFSFLYCKQTAKCMTHLGMIKFVLENWKYRI